MHAPKLHFGPGTRVGLLCVALVGTWQWVTQPAAPSLSELRSRVRRETPPPLRKPEPQEFLGRPMTLAQRRQVQGIVDQWRADRDELRRLMDRATSQPPDRSDLASLRGELAEYSTLSRLFNAKREAAWARARAVLDSKPQEDPR